MNLNNVNTTQDWTYYLSMINASSDPLDFLISSDNIPYKKFNRLKVSVKNKKNPNKGTTRESLTNI